MTWVNDLNRVNHKAANAIVEMAAMFPEESAGVLRRRVDEAAAQLRALGAVGRLAAVLLRFTAGLAQACVLVAGVLWATVGSLVMMTQTGGLGWGLLVFFANAGVTVPSVAFFYHLATPRSRRAVFGSAAFATGREAAERAGLSADRGREGRP
jgi:hypothetical protein